MSLDADVPVQLGTRPLQLDRVAIRKVDYLAQIGGPGRTAQRTVLLQGRLLDKPRQGPHRVPQWGSFRGWGRLRARLWHRVGAEFRFAGAVVGRFGLVEVAGQPGFGRIWSLAIA